MKKILTRKISLALLLVMCVAALTGCGGGQASSAGGGASGSGASGGGADGETKVLKMGHVYDATYPLNVAMEEMSKYVSEHTNGRYEIELYPSSALGGETDLIEGVNIGTVDMCFTATTPLANTVPSLAVLDLPFLIKDQAHADAVFFDENSEVRASLMSDIDAAGFKALTLVENGFRQLYTNKPINSVADLKGLKIRVMENSLHLELWNTLGASPTTMSVSEALTGIQQGTVDAVEMFHTAFLTTGFSELCKEYVKTNHIYTCGTVLMSAKVWNEMSPEDQKVFEEASATMMKATNEGLRAVDEENYEHIVNDLVESTCELDQTELQEMVASVYDNHPEYADMVAKIQAMAK